MERDEKLNRKAIAYSLAIKDFMVMCGVKEESAKSIVKMVQLAYMAGAAEADANPINLWKPVDGEDLPEGKKVYPVTKEECELLFEKMKEEGYEWDAEKKELKKIEHKITESESESIRKDIIRCLKHSGIKPDKPINPNVKTTVKDAIAWLEKQGNTNETINRDEFAQGVLRGAAINLITWIDYNAAEGNICLSNTECKDIIDALVSCNWDKIYDYIKKKLEKQEKEKEL